MSFPGYEINPRRILCTGNSPRFTYAKYSQSAAWGALNRSSLPGRAILSFRCGCWRLIILAAQIDYSFWTQIWISSFVPQRHSVLPTLSSLWSTTTLLQQQRSSLPGTPCPVRTVSKSRRATTAEIKLQLCQIFLVTKKACHKSAPCDTAENKKTPSNIFDAFPNVNLVFELILYCT